MTEDWAKLTTLRYKGNCQKAVALLWSPPPVSDAAISQILRRTQGFAGDGAHHNVGCGDVHRKKALICFDHMGAGTLWQLMTFSHTASEEMFISRSTAFFTLIVGSFTFTKTSVANVLPLTGSDGGILSQPRCKTGADTVQDAQWLEASMFCWERGGKVAQIQPEGVFQTSAGLWWQL